MTPDEFTGPTELRSASEPEAFIRVKAEQVTSLLNLAAELGLVTAEVVHHPDLAGLELENFRLAAHRLELLVREVQNLASELRLVSLGTVFRRIQRLVRDLSRQTGKPVTLEISGEETQIDKAIVDQLNDPLVHLVRNAVDHGLEPPDERRAAGKPETGLITLSARQEGGEILISLSDDGRGLNRQAILQRARELGFASPTEEPDDETVWRYIFRPGFSTARQATDLSGRGVGMDVVQAVIQSLRGRISIQSRAGQGTTFTLHLPLTLAFVDSMIVRRQKWLYAIPIEAVQTVLKPELAQVAVVVEAGSELVRLQDALVPVCRLENFYAAEADPTPLTEQILVVVSTSGGALGLPVDEIIGQEQVTLQPLRGHLENIRGGVGCAVLSSGKVAVALDCELLNRELMRLNGRQR